MVVASMAALSLRIKSPMEEVTSVISYDSYDTLIQLEFGGHVCMYMYSGFSELWIPFIIGIQVEVDIYLRYL